MLRLQKKPLPAHLNLTDCSWPFLWSCAIHAVLITIISCPAFQYPIFIHSQTPPIFWFSLISPSAASEEAISPLQLPSIAFAARQEESNNETSHRYLAKPDAAVPVDYQEIAPESPADTREPESPRIPPATEPAITRSEEERSSASEKKVQNNDAQIVRDQEIRATKERRERERAGVEIARQKQQANANELQKQKERKDALHKQVENQSQERQSAPLRAVSLPVIRGELKLVVRASTQPEITVTFTDFAPSRRDRPLNRTEARRIKKVVPLSANTQDSIKEVVIARAIPGIYTITAEPSGEAAYATLSLKLYEGTSGAVSRELGRHAIARKTVLIKILMPEGILWNDDSAFSGNMEDSDGVTKFNTETGLMWKEYSE